MAITPSGIKRETLLSTLRSLGPGWHSRGDLAQALGKNKLNPREIVVLDLMVETGELLRQSAPGGHFGVMQWQYRLKD